MLFMLPFNNRYKASEVHAALKYKSGHESMNKLILNIAYMQRFITRSSLKLIFSFVIKVSTSYLKDRFIYIKLEKSKIVLLN